MSVKSIIFDKATILSVVVLVLGVVYQDQITSLFHQYLKEYAGQSTNTSSKTAKSNIFTPEELLKFNGVDNEALYLAIVGVVFDVSAGRKHYEKGSSYHFFVGRDASRSFVTGNFADESTDADHVIDLTCDELDGLINWRDTFRKKYKSKGKVLGRFFDADGSPTKYSKEFKNKLKQCKLEKQLEAQVKQKYPPCNMEWGVGQGTRLWCTKNSGGINRDWVGVPRQLFTPGQEKPRCVCVNLKEDNSAALLKGYDECPSAAVSCTIKDSE